METLMIPMLNQSVMVSALAADMLAMSEKSCFISVMKDQVSDVSEPENDDYFDELSEIMNGSVNSDDLDCDEDLPDLKQYRTDFSVAVTGIHIPYTVNNQKIVLF